MAYGPEFDRPGTYQIRVQGDLEPEWHAWFDGLAIRSQSSHETLLAGSVPNQTSLYRMLSTILDLNLSLLSVERIEPASL